jgi:lipopolysaccharide export system permease protein
MLILDRYFIREVFKFLGIILVTVTSIFLAVEFFEKIDDFIEAGVSMQRAAAYFLLRIPYVLALLFPMAIFLSSLITLGLMNKRNELLALRSGGVSMIFFLRSLLSLGLLFSLVQFMISEILVPISSSKANQMYAREVDKKEALASKEKNIWIKGNRRITHIKYYNPSTQTISGITLYYFDEKFSLIRQVDAVSATFNDGKWVFQHILEQALSPKTGEYKTAFYEQWDETLEIFPEDVEEVAKKSEEMNVVELWEYIGTVENEGYDATRYRVDLQAKMALPFVNIILCVLALGIGVKRKYRDNLFAVIATGIGVALLFWILNSFCLSLGYGGVLPPIAAAWVANCVFACASVAVLSNLE